MQDATWGAWDSVIFEQKPVSPSKVERTINSKDMGGGGNHSGKRGVKAGLGVDEPGLPRASKRKETKGVKCPRKRLVCLVQRDLGSEKKKQNQGES